MTVVAAWWDTGPRPGPRSLWMWGTGSRLENSHQSTCEQTEHTRPCSPAPTHPQYSQVSLQGPSAARPNLSPIQPRAQSTHLLQDPPAGALCTVPPSRDPPPAPRTPSWVPRNPHRTPKTPNCAQAGLSRSGSGTPTPRSPGPQPFKRAHPKHPLRLARAHAGPTRRPLRAPVLGFPAAAALTPPPPQRRRRGNQEGAH